MRATLRLLGLVLSAGCSSGDGPQGPPAPVARVEVVPATLALGVGTSGTLTAIPRDANGAALQSRSIGWASSSEAVATVTQSGLVTGTGAGSATITATSDGQQGTASVSVTATPPPPSSNFALRLYGNVQSDLGRVKIPLDAPARPVDIGASDFTVEFWLRARPGDNGRTGSFCGGAMDWIPGNILLDRDRAGLGRKYGLSLLSGRVVFGYSTTVDTEGRSICSTSRVDDDQWHHVAITRTQGGALQLFVDGVRQATATGPAGDISYPDGVAGQAENDPFLVIGAEKHNIPGYPGFVGLLDELRLSTTIRYTGTFTRPTRRFTVDAQTAALYHFDEGTGTTLGDALGQSPGVLRVGGTPAGPAWVASDAPTGN